MKFESPVHALLSKFEYARNDYLTAFWRITPIVLVLLLVFTSACGPGKPLSTPSNAQPTTPVTARVPGSTPSTQSAPVRSTPTPTQRSVVPTLAVGAASLRGQHVSFWYAFPGGLPDTPQTNPMRALVDEFNRLNTWGITVDAVPYQSYEALYEQAGATPGDDMPSLVTGYSYQLLGLDESAHLLVDLAPYVQDARWGLSAQEQAGFNSLFWQQDVIDGKRFGLPFSRSAQLLFYNFSQAKDLGFSAPPTTAAEFAAQACAAAQANKKSKDVSLHGTGGWVINSDVPTMEGWLYAFGNSITASDGQSYALSTTQTTQAFTFLKNLLDQGCAWSTEDAFPAKQFASRQAIFITGSLEELDAQAKAFSEVGSQDGWTALPFLSPSAKPVIVAFGPSFAVLKSSPQKQLASWLFARWMVSPQNQASWIESSGSLPLGSGVLPLLAGYRARHPQWAAAVDLLSVSRLEPQVASWSQVRWALSDAGTRLFSPIFPANLIPMLVGMLRDTAAELDARGH